MGISSDQQVRSPALSLLTRYVSSVSWSDYFGKMTPETLKWIVTCVWLSVAAMVGCFFRIVLAQLFGEECANPGTVGWLAAGSPLCVTAGGNADVQGGIVFADLPANLLGSFIMGMMQPAPALGLPIDASIAWAAPDSSFQYWDIFHLAIRSGFCGSLTTYSSWNSEMVIIMFGTGVSHSSSVIRALFGYIIGMETALGSYVLGKKFALWIHRWRNPLNGKEMDAIFDRKEEGVYINRNLPEFERRFLPNLNMDNMGAEMEDVERLQLLERWRESTVQARRVKHPRLNMLIEIETAILIDRRPAAPHRAGATARTLNWDVDALEQWSKGMAPTPGDQNKNDSVLFAPEFSALILFLLFLGLLTALFAIQSATSYAITYRTMVYATLLAPPGALLRWYLTGLNGALPGNWAWLPAGTMTANVGGSILSIALISAEYITYASGFWPIASMRAIKIGFTGSLTTVSTFVSEINELMKNPRMQDRAYVYMGLSLSLSCILSVLMYTAVVYGSGRH